MWEKLKKLSRNSFSGAERLLVFALLLSCLASPLWAADWAFLRNSKAEKELAVEPVATQAESLQEEPALQEASQESATESTNSKQEQIERLQKDFEQFKKELNSKLAVTNDLKKNFDSLEKSFSESRKLEEVEDAVHEETLKENAALKEKVNEYEIKENSTRPFVKLNGLMGFSEVDSTPRFGAGLTLGLRYKTGITLEAGANYMFGGLDDFGAVDVTDPVKRNMLFTTSIGYEW